MTTGRHLPDPPVLAVVAVSSLARSGDLPVAAAVAMLVDSGGVRFRDTPLGQDPQVQAALVAAQVAPADLESLVEDSWQVACISEVLGWLDQIARRHPTMGVRDAIGWVFSVVDASPQVLPYSWVQDTIGPWLKAGFANDGWLYAAAGLTPAEAAEARDAGTLDPGAAWALAGLRGALLPA